MAKKSSGSPFFNLINKHSDGVEFAIQRGDILTAVSHQESLAILLSTKLPRKPFYDSKYNIIVGGQDYKRIASWINGNRPIIASGIMTYIREHKKEADEAFSVGDEGDN